MGPSGGEPTKNDLGDRGNYSNTVLVSFQVWSPALKAPKKVQTKSQRKERKEQI